jgi:hypothetical protein
VGRKTEKTRKKITEKTELWKKPIKILKKPIGSVRFGFGFISLKPKKPNPTQTEPNWKNQAELKKPSQTGKNRAKIDLNRFLSKKLNRTETGRFEPVSVFF